MEDVNETGSARRLLALVKPRKPLGEMTDDELDAFANAIFDQIAPDARPRQHSAQDLAGEDETEVAPRTQRQRPQHSPQNVECEEEATDARRSIRTQRSADPNHGV